MNASNLSSSPGMLQSSADSVRSCRSELFVALGRALEAGDLAGAQKTFAAFQAARPPGEPAHKEDRGSAELKTLLHALTRNDLTGAQLAFAAFQKEVQAARGGRRCQFDSPAAPSPANPASSGLKLY